MTGTRSYVSPKRQAKAEATRHAILEAFREQLIEPGRDQLSPTDAAAAAGCSVRTVHGYFPTQESRILGLAELDGAFIDSHEVGRSYGTAIALVCLDLLAGLSQ